MRLRRMLFISSQYLRARIRMFAIRNSPSKSLAQYTDSLNAFQPTKPSTSTQLPGCFETAARSPTPDVAAAVCSADSSTVLTTTVAAHFKSCICTGSTCAAASSGRRVTGLGTAT